ncbi:hypothetical protein D9M68_858190 [compost metagenome]
MVGAPIVGHQLEGDGATSIEAVEFIGPRAQWRLQSGFSDVAGLASGVRALPPMLWQHHQLAEDQRKFAVAGLVEGEGNFTGRRYLCGLDVDVVLLAVRIDLDQLVEGPDHILG